MSSSNVTVCRSPAALVGALCARVLDENAAHEPCGDGEEVRAILPHHPVDIDQPQIGLVDQGRRLENVPGPLAGHLAAREAEELLATSGMSRSKAWRSPPAIR